MKELLKKDLKIKIISLLVAIFLWLYVYNYDNPMRERTISGVPLRIENFTSLEDKDLKIKNDYKKTVDIRIKARQEILDKVSINDFVAVLDFSAVNSVEDKTVEISDLYPTQKDIEIISHSPIRIVIDVVRMKSNTFPVEVTRSITFKPGYEALEITTSLDSIKLEGEEADIDSVDVIRGKLELKDLDRDTTKRVELKVYNKSDKEIPSLSRNLSVDVTVRVAKVVPLNLVVTGTPHEDYVEISRGVSPNMVKITGTPEALSAISSLSTEAVSIEGIKQDLNATTEIKLPNGVKLAEQSKAVAVNIDVEQLIIKDFDIKNTDTEIRNSMNDASLTYEIKTESAVIQLKGRASVLNALNIANLRPYVDAAGLDEGTHKLPLNITLPSQVKLMSSETLVEIKVTKVQPATTEEQ